MASSVSSERAFSSAGITISKRCNRLKGDIVEALQFLKCLIRRDLVFRENPTESLVDDFGDDELDELLDDEPIVVQAPSWDEMFLEDEEELDE